MKPDCCHTLYMKVNSKQIKYLNVRHETTELIEENIDKNLLNISRSNFFQNTSPQAREAQAKINKSDYIKLKTSAQLRKPSAKKKCNIIYERLYSK